MNNLLPGIARVLLFGAGGGALAALGALGFVESVHWLNDIAHVTPALRENLPSKLTLLLVLPPVIGGLIAGALIRFLPEKRAQNPADVIQAAQLSKPVSIKNGALTALAAIAGLGGGASVGIYGPLVHLGASIGSGVARYCRAEPGLGIGCGVAAAIATAFNAPIAGIIFAHEVVLRHYSLRAFAPITVASSTGMLIAAHIFNRPPLFEIEVARAVFAPEFFAFVLVGISGALVAVVFMRAILFMARIAETIKISAWLKPSLAGLCVGVTGLWLPEILGAGGGTLRLALGGAYSAGELSILLIVKIFATALCLGFGFAGGVLSPALLIGVLFGAFLAHVAGVVYPGHAGIEFYAICGMVAVTAPVIGAPLAAILLVFELTRNYALTTAALLSVAFSNLVACRLFGRSLFDKQLSLRGFDLSLGRDKARLAHATIATLIETDFVRAHEKDSAHAVQKKLLAAGRNEAFVAKDDGAYLGMLTLHQLLAAENARRAAGEIARRGELEFRDDMPVWDAMQAMQGFVGESIPVVTARATLAGVVYESALVAEYLRTARELRAEENADR